MLPWSVHRLRLVRRSATAFAFLLLCLPVLGASIGTTSPVRAATHAVEIGDGFFSPASLTVAVGDTVTWTNADDSPHTVSAGGFDSGNLDPGATFSFTFTEAGTFAYVCSYHDEMTASITVAAGSPTTAATPAPSVATAPAAPAATHQQGADGGEQPDTALPQPASGAMAGWVAPLLIGVGLVAFAFGVVPVRGAAAPSPQPRDPGSGGWRR